MWYISCVFDHFQVQIIIEMENYIDFEIICILETSLVRCLRNYVQKWINRIFNKNNID